MLGVVEEAVCVRFESWRIKALDWFKVSCQFSKAQKKSSSLNSPLQSHLIYILLIRKEGILLVPFNHCEFAPILPFEEEIYPKP